MRARPVLQMMDDDGETIATETVADLAKMTKGAEDLGLSLSEAKTLLAKLQQAMVETQVEMWLRENRDRDGRHLRSKGSYPIAFHTLFGDVRLKSPRYYLPRPAGGNGPATISPLRTLIPPAGRAVGRRAADRLRRQPHDSPSAHSVRRLPHRAGVDGRTGLFHARFLPARLDEPAHSRRAYRHRSGWWLHP